MGERKVLNKYYPPDFDPELLPRNRKPRDRQIEVRIMIPFTMCCSTCKEFMYRGKKFNSKKEIAQDVNYLGIHIHRFFIKCTRCASEIVFRTDPQNADYHMEHGATRNYEVWNDRRDQEDSAIAEREEEEAGDAMKQLENRTMDSKIEMDILDSLDDTKAINERHQKVNTDKIIQRLREGQEADPKDSIELDEEEEDLVEKVEFQANARRIAQEEEDAHEQQRKKLAEEAKLAAQRGLAAAAKAEAGEGSSSGGGAAGSGGGPKRLAGLVVKRKVETAEEEPPAKAQKGSEAQGAAAAGGAGLAGLMGGYSDSGSASD